MKIKQSERVLYFNNSLLRVWNLSWLFLLQGVMKVLKLINIFFIFYVQSHQTIHFGLCTVLITRALTQILNCKLA
jgi:hypothetical protein